MPGYAGIRQDTAGYTYYRNTVILGKPYWVCAHKCVLCLLACTALLCMYDMYTYYGS